MLNSFVASFMIDAIFLSYFASHSSGREISFTGPPRTFHFQGDERYLHVYNVASDTGITWDAAKQMYEEAVSGIKPNGRSNGLKTKRSKSGFYIDDRGYISRGYPNCLGKKIWLVIYGENSSDRVLVSHSLCANEINYGVILIIDKFADDQAKLRKEIIEIFRCQQGFGKLPSMPQCQ